MASELQHKYTEIYPSEDLSDYIASYFEAINLTDLPEEHTICPDGYFKLIVQLQNGKITAYFLTGIWAKEIELVVQPNVITYGIRFKIIAAEYLLRREVRSVLNTIQQLDLDAFEMNTVNFSSFPRIVEQFETLFRSRIPNDNDIKTNRVRLSQFLYSSYEDIKASEVAEQIYWSQREINRYLSKYVGVSLKKYLNIQKCYRAYFQIRDGEFFPEKGFFDQAHFIREVKKHTGKTPRQLYHGQNDQFIQLKNMKRK